VIDGNPSPQHHLPINQGPIRIQSGLFEGSMEIHLRGLPNTQQQLFESKKRFFQVLCQVGGGDGVCVGRGVAGKRDVC
jgi:hypothetical protein